MPRLTLLLVLAFLLLPAVAAAETLTVTTTEDSLNGACTEELCSLRDAVVAANASAEPDEIVLAAGEYVLDIEGTDDTAAAGDLDLLLAGGETTITGAGARSTVIDAGGIDRVLHLPDGAEAVVGAVTLTGGSLTGDIGGAIHQQGGTLTLEAVAVSGNQVLATGRGGAIGSDGELAIYDSTLSGNRGTGNGGALYLDFTATTVIVNSTLAGNRLDTTTAPPSYGAYGGAIENYGSLVLISSTITGNTVTDPDGGETEGEGVWGEIEIAVNAIIAGNATVGGGTEGECSHPVLGAGLDDDGTCFDGADAVQADPLLGTLGDHGGPTDTVPLLPGSPAIDAGLDSGVEFDQRGVARPQGPQEDLGAFEFRPGNDLKVDVAAPAQARFGDTITQFVTVTARAVGDADATGVTLDHALTGMALTGVSSSQGSCTAGATVICTLGTLARGAHATVTITGTAEQAAQAEGRARVDHARPEVTPADNSDTAITSLAPANPGVEKLQPALTLRVRPRRDRTRPFRYRARGRLVLPAGVSAGPGCLDSVVIRVRRGKRTVARRSVRLTQACRYRKRIRIKPSRLGRAGKLRFRASWGGSPVLRSARSRQRIVRYGKR